MEALFGPIMLVGKYVFLALIYGFLYWAFRGLFSQAAQETATPRVVAATQPPVIAAPVQPVPAPAAPPAAVRRPAVAAEIAPPAPLEVLEEPLPVETAPAIEEQPLVLGPPAAPLTLPKPALLVQDPGKSDLQAGQVIELTAAITIGRGDDNGLVIVDKFCSTHHALIYLQRGQRLLRDRDSTNGTYLNGAIISEDVVLRDGDRLGIGTVVFSYRAGVQ